MAKAENKIDKSTQSVTEKLKNLYRLQLIDTKIDQIRILRGELPLEVIDLEFEFAGLETRLTNFKKEITKLNEEISFRENAKLDSRSSYKKYTEQQNKFVITESLILKQRNWVSIFRNWVWIKNKEHKYEIEQKLNK